MLLSIKFLLYSTITYCFNRLCNVARPVPKNRPEHRNAYKKYSKPFSLSPQAILAAPQRVLDKSATDLERI